MLIAETWEISLRAELERDLSTKHVRPNDAPNLRAGYYKSKGGILLA